MTNEITMPSDISSLGSTVDGAASKDGATSKDGVQEPAKKYTKEELKTFVAEVARRIVESNASYMHSMLALNHILRLPNAQDILDDDLKDELRDIWIKLKSMGLQLTDPPLLVGHRELPQAADDADDWVDVDEENPAKSETPS